MSQLKVNSIVPVGGLPSGSNGGIIQIKQTIKKDTTSISTAANTEVNTDSTFNVSITPSTNSSKILILGYINVCL